MHSGGVASGRVSACSLCSRLVFLRLELHKNQKKRVSIKPLGSVYRQINILNSHLFRIVKGALFYQNNHIAVHCLIVSFYSCIAHKCSNLKISLKIRYQLEEQEKIIFF